MAEYELVKLGVVAMQGWRCRTRSNFLVSRRMTRFCAMVFRLPFANYYCFTCYEYLCAMLVRLPLAKLLLLHLLRIPRLRFLSFRDWLKYTSYIVVSTRNRAFYEEITNPYKH